MSVKAKIIVTIFCVMDRMAMGLTWTREELYSTLCEGQDKLFMWNCSLESNETLTQIQWFYNKTILICHYSASRGFIVTSSYRGRVEQSGTTGILLKKVSALDTGEYAVYPQLAREHTQNIQTTFLKVYETPTFQCKPYISVHSKNIIYCSANSCGGQEFSPEWRVFGERDPVGNQSYLKVNSSWNDELVFCCLQGPNMKCNNGDLFKFCASIHLLSTDNDGRTKEDIPDTKYLNYVKSPNCCDTETLGSLMLAMLTIVVVLTAEVNVIFIAGLYHYRNVILHRGFRAINRIKRGLVVNNFFKEKRQTKRANDSEYSSKDQERQNLSHGLQDTTDGKTDSSKTVTMHEINDSEDAEDAEIVIIHGQGIDI